MITRRSLLLRGAVGVGAAVAAGCSTPPAPALSASTPAPAPRPGGQAALEELEARFGGRLGVYAVDTATGATVGRRVEERFLMCSTAKVPLVAAVLGRSRDEPGLLERRIRYSREDLLEYAPVTTRNIATGMTVAELCDAAVTVSDNAAANLLFAQVGGPAEVTGFVRGLGDPTSRFDRTEPSLNDTTVGDERDTTTPFRFAHTLRALAVGDVNGSDVVPVAQRDRLVGWMLANTTGAAQIRAGAPAGWRVGDKTGSGSQGESHDVAVLWPPERAPIVLTVFTSPVDPQNPNGKSTIAAATRTVLGPLGLAA